MTLIFLLVVTLPVQASKIRIYQDRIKTLCPNEKVSLLLLKKSLIELIKGEGCEGRFTALVQEKCNDIQCQDLDLILRKIEQDRSGLVVGD